MVMLLSPVDLGRLHQFSFILWHVMILIVLRVAVAASTSPAVQPGVDLQDTSASNQTSPLASGPEFIWS